MLPRGVGDSVIHDKLYNTVGYRKDGIHEKFVGLRPGRYQGGDYQVEFSIRSARINTFLTASCFMHNTIVIDTTTPTRIDKYHVDLGNVVLENYSSWHRQMVKVPDNVKSVDDFVIEYEIILTGYHLQDETQTETVIRPKCAVVEVDSIDALTRDNMSFAVYNDTENHKTYIKGNGFREAGVNPHTFKEYILEHMKHTQRVIDEIQRRDELITANSAVRFLDEEGNYISVYEDENTFDGGDWHEDFALIYDTRDLIVDTNSIHNFVKCIPKIVDTTVPILEFISNDDFPELSNYKIENPVVMDQNFSALTKDNYHTLKRVDGRWIYTKYAGWGYILSRYHNDVKYVDLTINGRDFNDSSSPYTVDEVDDIEAMMAATSNDWRGYGFIMENDIDMDGASVTSGGINNFTGTFDGGGYSIKNYTVHNTSSIYTGFFGTINGATIKNLTIGGNCSFTSRYHNAGVFVGYAYGNFTIENCTLSMYGDMLMYHTSHTSEPYLAPYGSRAGESSPVYYNSLGGIVGRADGLGIIRNCNNMMTVLYLVCKVWVVYVVLGVELVLHNLVVKL